MVYSDYSTVYFVVKNEWESINHDIRTNRINYNYVSYDVYYSSIVAKTKKKTPYEAYGMDERKFKQWEI
jgi:hypothetical protein